MKCFRMPSNCETRYGIAYGPTSGGICPPQTLRTCDASQSRSVAVRMGFIVTASSSSRDGLVQQT